MPDLYAAEYLLMPGEQLVFTAHEATRLRVQYERVTTLITQREDENTPDHEWELITEEDVEVEEIETAGAE